MPTTPCGPAAQRERERLQARRLRAAELFGVGVRQAQVARHLGVSPKVSATGMPAGRLADPTPCAVGGRTGPTPRLSDRQLGRVEQALLEGATANGFTGELWTLDRIATVIERLTGVPSVSASGETGVAANHWAVRAGKELPDGGGHPRC
jgi:transposase